MIDPKLFSDFLRTLGLVAPLVGHGEVTVIANAAAAYIDAGADGHSKFAALTAEMKARQDAGISTTAAEILADVERIQALDRQIQDS